MDTRALAADTAEIPLVLEHGSRTTLGDARARDLSTILARVRAAGATPFVVECLLLDPDRTDVPERLCDTIATSAQPVVLVLHELDLVGGRARALIDVLASAAGLHASIELVG